MYALHNSNNVKDRHRRTHYDWIDPAQFNSLHFIYDPRDMKCDRTPWTLRDSNERQA